MFLIGSCRCERSNTGRGPLAAPSGQQFGWGTLPPVAEGPTGAEDFGAKNFGAEKGGVEKRWLI
jgi:hypothetical protein